MSIADSLAGFILFRRSSQEEEEMLIRYQEGDDFFRAGRAQSKFPFTPHTKMKETKDYYILFKGRNFLQDGIAIPKLSFLDEGYEERVAFLISRIQEKTS